jgi:mannose-6-phosphate isomerase-like protein (cupin superfamily)
MKAYTTDIEHEAEGNRAFRRVLFTGPNMQLVLMSLKPGEEIGNEVHSTHDQFFRIEEGEARLETEGERTKLKEGEVAIVSAGTRHNIVNTSGHEELKMYTIYAPPQHPDGTVHLTKADADRAEAVHA